MWRNWQTRWLQVPVGETPWRFESSHPHFPFLPPGINPPGFPVISEKNLDFFWLTWPSGLHNIEDVKLAKHSLWAVSNPRRGSVGRWFPPRLAPPPRRFFAHRSGQPLMPNPGPVRKACDDGDHRTRRRIYPATCPIPVDPSR